MNKDKDKLAEALEAAARNPARSKSGKSLVNLIIDNWEGIQKSRINGVTYKQIAENMEVDYKCFLTSIDRAKKKIKSHPELIERSVKNDDYNDSVNSISETISNEKKPITSKQEKQQNIKSVATGNKEESIIEKLKNPAGFRLDRTSEDNL